MDVLRAQKTLHKIGYDPGFCDGILGPKTQSALNHYIADHLVVAGARLEWLPAVDLDFSTYAPYSLAALEMTYGPFEYESTPSGWILQDLRWQNSNLRELKTPWGRCRVHRKEHDRFTLLVAALMKHDYKIKEFLTWQPRHKGLDPTRGLSTHCWGIAVDINPDENGVGTPGKIPEQVVTTFEDFGFVWGGRWEKIDPMHFQLCTRY